MNLNFILFPAPKKRYTKEQHKGELIWIPKLKIENDSNKENEDLAKQQKVVNNDKQPKIQKSHRRCQSQVISKTDLLPTRQTQNNTTIFGKNSFNQTLNTRVSFFRHPVKKNDEMDKSYIEAETFIIHNEDTNDDHNMNVSQDERMIKSIKSSLQAKPHSYCEAGEQRRSSNFSKNLKKIQSVQQSSSLQQQIVYMNTNALKIPLTIKQRECTNESFQSCSMLQESTDEDNIEQYSLQSPKNISNYVTTTFFGNSTFSSRQKTYSFFANQSTSTFGSKDETKYHSNSSNNHHESVSSFNTSQSSVSINNQRNNTNQQQTSTQQQRQLFRQIEDKKQLNNYFFSSRQTNQSNQSTIPKTFTANIQPQTAKEKYLQHVNNVNKTQNNPIISKNQQQIFKQPPLLDRKQSQATFTQVYNQVQNANQQKSFEICFDENHQYIPCLYLKSQQPSNYVLIYFHGNGEDISLSYEMTDHLRKTLKVNVLAVEYQGYGVYEGEPDENQILKDTLYVYSYLTQQLKYDPKHILILGRSIGTGPATWLAANKKVGGLILVSPFTSIKAVAKHVAGSIAQHLIKERFVNIDNIQKVICPTFIVHGQQDRLIPYQQSQQLHDFCRGPCQLTLPKKMTHVELDFYSDLTNPLQAFLLKSGINIRLDNSMLTYNKYIQIPKDLFEEPTYHKQPFMCYY